MYVLLTISAIISFVILKLILQLYRLNEYLSEIPKLQPCSWYLGHFPAFTGLKDVFPETAKMVNKQGGLIRLIFPPRIAVVTTNKSIIKTIKNQGFKGSSLHFLRPWLQEGLLTSDGAKWRERKKLLSSCFGNSEILKNFIKIYEEKSNELVEILEHEINKKLINVMPLVKNYAMKVLCESALGMPMETKYFDSYIKSVENLCTVIGHRYGAPYKIVDFLFRFTEDYRNQQRSLKLVNSYFDEVFEKKLKMANVDLDKIERLSFIDSLIKSYQSGGLTKDDIQEEVNTFMFAGFDTTSIAMAFILYLLAHNPTVQEKVVQEQIDIFESLEPNEPINYDHLQRMKYLEMVMMEAMRLYPPVPLVTRMLTEDIPLDNGVVLPKSCILLIYIYGCHHNPEYFPNPENFIPERFEKDQIDPWSFIPFSTGQRVCIGKKFSILETKSCISKIIRHFRLLPSNPDTKPQLTYRMTMESTNGVNISLEKRHTE